MFLRKAYDKRISKTYLSIVHGYRTEDGKYRSKVIKSIGYLEDLKEQYSDPIAHFTAVAKEMDQERLADSKFVINVNTNEKLDPSTQNIKNYGYIIYSKIFHELELDRFLNNARRHKNFSYNSEAIMRMLVFTRLIKPCSKRASLLFKDMFFDKFDFTIDDVYHALDHFDDISERLQKHLHEKAVEQYNRKTDLVYYDVTNYYFETEQQGELKRKGYSKEGRKNPIVQMGLLMDTNGLPISYKLFSGNTHDSQTLMPILKNLKKQFGVKRMITVADKGLNSGDNIVFNTALGDGYIYSKSIRGASDDFKKWVLDEEGYALSPKGKIKSKLVPNADVRFSDTKTGNKTTKKKATVEQKWIVFYSEKYAKRAKHKRDEVVAKAMKLIGNPSKYQRTFDFGAAGYINNIKIDKETGEIKNTKEVLTLNEEKIKEEEKYDGYYAIITSELDTDDEHIIDMYKGLWRIEENFKISKSILSTRPIYLQTEKHINAHFLTCFISLFISRAVEVRMGRQYPISRITETIRNITCTKIEQNLWLFHHSNEITEAMDKVFGTDFGQKYLTQLTIKKIFPCQKNRVSNQYLLAKSRSRQPL